MYESINKVGEKKADSTKMETETLNNKKVIESGKQILYDLIGIVVHSGQANAGHYYSFIKGNVCNRYFSLIIVIYFGDG